MFYLNWSSPAGYRNNQDTICIPPSLDLMKSYFGPEDTANVNQKGILEGRLGESAVLLAFQKLKGHWWICNRWTQIG